MIIPISFAGQAGCGKTTLAIRLTEYLNRNVIADDRMEGLPPSLTSRKFAWADEVKAIARLFGWNGEKDEKGRRLLQIVGTEAGRAYNPNIWVEKLTAQMEARHMDFQIAVDPGNIMWRCAGCEAEGEVVRNVTCCTLPKPEQTIPPWFAVIDDTRFENELSAVSELLGLNILVERPDSPVALKGKASEHASEQGLPRSFFDAILINDHESVEHFLDHAIQTVRGLLFDKKGLQV